MAKASGMDWLRLVSAIVIGVVVGGVINGLIVQLGHMLVPLPAGVDVSTPDGFAQALKQFTPMHFAFPFLAHAIGTLIGAFIAAKIASILNHKLLAASVVGGVFFAGGFMMVQQVDAPLWFDVLDLGLAYIPMAWLGYRLATGAKRR